MIGKLEYYVNRAIPYVWDDSESWYEFLAKVIAKVNELVDMSNDYFDKDVSEHVEQILIEWYDSGKLSDIVNSALGEGLVALEAKLEQNAVVLDDYHDGVLSHEIFYNLVNNNTHIIINKDVKIICDYIHTPIKGIKISSHNKSRLEIVGSLEYPLINTLGSIVFDNVGLIGEGLFIYSSMRSGDVIETISLNNCYIGGDLNKSLNIIYLTTPVAVNPNLGFFGVNKLSITNNKIEDLYAQNGKPILLTDVGYRLIEFKDNQVENFFPRIIDASIRNDATYDLLNIHESFVATGNTFIHSKDFKPYETFKEHNTIYYSPFIIESVNAEYRNNYVEGLHYIKGSQQLYEVNVYPAYLSSNNVSYKDNTFKNVMTFSDTKIYGDLFKSKFGDGLREYIGNNVSIDESFYDEMNVASYGVAKESMWKSIYAFQGDMGDVVFKDNYIKIPYLEIHRNGLSYIERLYMENNVFKIIGSRTDRNITLAVVSDRTKLMSVKNNRIESESLALKNVIPLHVLAENNPSARIEILDNRVSATMLGSFITGGDETKSFNRASIDIRRNVFDGVNTLSSGLLRTRNFKEIKLDNELLNVGSDNGLINPLGNVSSGVDMADRLEVITTYEQWATNTAYFFNLPSRVYNHEIGDSFTGVLEIESDLFHGVYILEFTLNVTESSLGKVLEMTAPIAYAPNGVVDETTEYTTQTMVLDGSGNNNSNQTVKNVGRSNYDITNVITMGTRLGFQIRMLSEKDVSKVKATVKLFKR